MYKQAQLIIEQYTVKLTSQEIFKLVYIAKQKC